MGDLKRYSGLTTKVKAMRSRLVSNDEYLRLIECDKISEIAEFLKGKGGFDKALEKEDLSNIHRETLEHAILYSGYNAYEKLYKFAGMEQRRYLKLYFMTYEIEIIKKALRKSGTTYISKGLMDMIREVFSKRSKVNYGALFRASDFGDIVAALEGSIYYEPIKKVYDYGSTNTFDYELALDMFYFRHCWKKRRQQFGGKELHVISDILGTECDLLNLLWIYRAKKFYNMTRSEVAAMVIPIYKRVKREQIAKLIETNDTGELIAEIGKTFYGRYLTAERFEHMQIDKVSRAIVTKVYDKYYRTEPYSLAVMSSYMRAKRIEMNNLITIVECVRYSYPKDTIAKSIVSEKIV